MASVFLYDSGYSVDATRMEDNNDNWIGILSGKPAIVAPERKATSSCVCGAEFLSSSKIEDSNNLKYVHAFVLDIDCWDQDNKTAIQPYTIVEIKQILSGNRFIAWTTWSSTKENRRWRVVIPFAFPLPVELYSSLYAIITQSAELFNGTASSSLDNPGRLGFFGTAKDQKAVDDYEWYIQEGELFDWTPLRNELIECPLGQKIAGDLLAPEDLILGPEAISIPEALPHIRKWIKTQARGVEKGDRHNRLLAAAITLWWDWALDEDTVTKLIFELNAQFSEPKDDDFVTLDIKGAWDRCLGPKRLLQQETYGFRREPVERATQNRFLDLAKRLNKASSKEQRAIAKAVKNMATGDFICDAVEVKQVINTAVKTIAREWYKEDPKYILSLIMPSLNAQRAATPDASVPNDHNLLGLIKLTAEKKQNEINARVEEKASQEKMRLQQAFGSERDYGYTESEYAAYAEKGLKPNHWIIQHNRSYYFFVGGEYKGPFPEAQARNFAQTMLSPAEGVLQLCSYGKNHDVKTKSLETLVQEYGTWAMVAERRLGSVESIFLPLQSKVQQGVCPLLESLSPEFSPEVDTWLRLLALEKYSLLEQYLTGFTYLDRAIVALALATAPGAGKNLLVQGLARLWGGFPVSMHDYRPEMLESAPIVWCDERLPRQYQNNFGATLKRWVAEPAREVKKPYIEVYTLMGFPRLMFTANDMQDLQLFKEAMFEGSVDALRERLLYIDTSQHPRKGEARAYLESLGSKHREFLTKDVLAKHVLWLKENKHVDFDNRFLVVDRDIKESEVDTTTLAIVSQDDVSTIYSWITKYLLLRRFGQHAAFLARDGQLLVHSTELSNHWVDLDVVSRLSYNQITKGITKISSNARRKINVGKIQANYRMLDMKKYFTWLSKDYAEDLQDIKEALAILEKSKPFSFV